MKIAERVPSEDDINEGLRLFREQESGSFVHFTSTSGLIGNFGQSNYGAAKMALVGLMQTLAIEGEKHDIRVNCLAPTAATRPPRPTPSTPSATRASA